MTVDFKEIKSDDKFEDLVAIYFEDLMAEGVHSITSVNVKPSGNGTDGGRDILIDFKLNDNIATFDRRWIVQCKFHESSISTNKIADVNIPTLIHSYNATGYLLVCKNKPTSKLTDMFERLNEKCTLKYQYIIWSGEQFKRFILTKSKPNILKQFFPKYYAYGVAKKLFKK